MNHKKIRAVGALALAAVWICLVAASWFGAPKEISLAERRPLEQMPEISADALLDGSFMEDFEDYSLDQFPLRDTFRTIKSLFHYYVLNQSDNNDIYIADGSAAQIQYPLNQGSIDHAVKRFAYVYEKYLKDSGANVYLALVPDKGYYLAEPNGYPAMDYEAMFTGFREGMPWAEFIDLTGALTAEDYYRTDTHWRHEALMEAAQALGNAMGVNTLPGTELVPVAAERPFYGVYYGQAALPMEPDELFLLDSDLLSGCATYLGEWDMKANAGVFNKLYDGVYDLEKLDGNDPYEVYLSGPESLVRVENPNAGTDRELVIFRDSFASSIVPLLLEDYAAVTLVDIRYIQADMLSRFPINWECDVLFLYSTLVLNNSSTIK